MEYWRKVKWFNIMNRYDFTYRSIQQTITKENLGRTFTVWETDRNCSLMFGRRNVIGISVQSGKYTTDDNPYRY